jgi:hypothetical protein
MGSQEVSKPVMIAVIAVAVLVIGFIGWYFFMKPQQYPGYQAPAGPGMGGQTAPPSMPGQAPGGAYPPPGPPPGTPR